MSRFIGVVLAFVVWTFIASAIYCFGFARYDLRLALALFQPPYCQWFEAAWYWMTIDTPERVRVWLQISAIVPTIASVLIVVTKINGNSMRRRFPTWRSPWANDSQRPIERGVTDNHGHSRMMTEAELRREFPPIR